ncbi:tyrosine-type recombinase/integrase [Actinoplanes sp. NPDC051633]|uniref:tyrosine-type recombinase/integrase n=1 Tax=Actinoplanes sp. NPDC051633 TaxID=3155670 RepID=UPI00343ABFDE
MEGSHSGLDGKERAKHFTTRAAAMRWEADQKATVARGTWVDPNSKETFLTYYTEWASRQVWESNTTVNMNYIASTATFAKIPIVKIKRAHVENWVKAMQTSGLAASTITARMGNIRTVFRAAVRDHVIATDPAAGVILPRLRRRDSSLKMPAVDQVRTLLIKSENRFRAFIGLGAFAGLRFGEIAALRVEDIDFTASTIWVERQIQRARGAGVEIRQPKYGSERTVHMAEALAAMLRVHIERYMLKPEGWLFPGENNLPLCHNSCQSSGRRRAASATLPGCGCTTCATSSPAR